MKLAPNPKEPQNFQFKQSTTRTICDVISNPPTSGDLIATDCKRGLIYIGHENKITVLPCSEKEPKQQSLEHTLALPICRISLSCDFSYFAVTFNSSTAHIYNAASVFKNSLELLHEIQLSSTPQQIYAFDLKWNPAIPGSFCTIASDYSIGSFSLKLEQKFTVTITALERIQNLEPTCVAWSPKGKQIVVGCRNGNIVQLKPELKIARSIPGPTPSIGEALAITWLSNYQFCVAYSDIKERRINVLIVDAPKGESTATFTNYEDITFGMPPSEELYSPRYYLEHITEWNIIIAASSCSSEIAVLGSSDAGVKWEQWQLIDSGRAELPCIKETETYPLGISIDKTPQNLLPWADEKTLPYPVPVLHIFGNSGRMSSFHIVNLAPNCPTLCSAPWEPATLAVAATVSPEVVPRESTNRMSLLPSEISFSLNSGATSTPRPKATEVSLAKAQNVPASNLFEEKLRTPLSAPTGTAVGTPLGIVQGPSVGMSQATLPAAQLATPAAMSLRNTMGTSTATPKAPNVGTALGTSLRMPSVSAPQQSSAPASTPPVELKVPKPKSNVAAVQKSDARPLQVKEVAAKPVIDNSICLRLYREEKMIFESELKKKTEPINAECGTLEEKQKLITQSAQIEEFLEELKEATKSLDNDISYLNALLLQSFAWIEETKSRNFAGDSERRHDRSKIKELQKMYINTHSQLIQATKALDMEWTEYQLRDKSKMKIPSLEFVYQSLKRHAEIIAKEKSIVEAQVKKWKLLSKNSKVTKLNRSMSKLSLGEFSAVNSQVASLELRCRSIANNCRSFSQEKQTKLCEFLMQTKPRVIKTVNPTPVQDKLKSILSSLASPSSVATPPKPRVAKPPPVNAPVPLTPTSIGTLSSISITPIIQKTTAPTTSAGTSTVISIPQLPNAVLDNPLASLNSIVDQIGKNKNKLTSGALAKSQPIQFSMSSPSPEAFGVVSAVDKISLGSTLQLNKSPQVMPPVITSPSILPKMLTRSFGSQEQKPVDIPTTSISKEVAPTAGLFGAKTLPAASPISTGLFKPPTLTKINTSTSQVSSPPILASRPSLSISFKDSPLTATTRSVFSFANQAISAVPTSTSLASGAPVSTQVNLTVPSLTVGLSDKKPSDTATTTTSIFGKLPMPSTTFNLSKPAITTSTTTATTSAQEVKIATTLSGGATIEKLLAVTSTPTTTSSLFDSHPGLFSGTTPSPSTTSTFVVTPSTSVPSTPASVVVTSTPTSPASTVASQVVSSAEKPVTTSAPISVTTSQLSQPVTATTSISSSGFDSPSVFDGMLNAGMSSFNFGKLPTSSATPITSIFGKSAASPAAPSTASIFGQAASPVTTSASIFGGASTATTTATTTSSIFGGTATPSTSSSAIFGQAATATTAPTSIFGTAATLATTTSTSIFGTAATPATTTSAPIFGQPVTTSSTTSIFGQPASTTTASSSIFGQPTASQSGSIFGQTSTTSSSIFGQAPVTTAASIFGQPAVTTAPSIFGGAPTTPATSSSNIFGSPATSSAPQGSIFGGMATPSGNIFGGTPQPESGSIFGAASSAPFGTGASSIFGGAPKPPSGNIFSDTSSTFGSPMGMAAAANAAASPGTAFGGTAAFGSKPVFGTMQPVFGSPTSEFGGTPAFGTQTTFGFASPPAMGAPPNMPGKVFGSENSTFESLAGQSGGITFGSLAQKSPEKTPPPAFAGGSSFSTWR